MWNCSHVNSPEWFGVVGQQAIIWVTVEPDPCHQMGPPNHNAPPSVVPAGHVQLRGPNFVIATT